ncbi:HAD-IA family hydrolase [Plantactinospora sp. B5E13]|uniref:HAD-IA family hydrolase n=1 Tax=unclassified Plantactinospora TaxID=2631981 RepID=UPI00325C5D6F
MRRERPTALLVDLDGVLRRWDPEVAAEAERRHGLPVGALVEVAFDWPLLRAAVTGQLSHAEWMTAVVDRLTERAGGRESAQAAVDEWQAYRGEVDPDVLALARDARAAGVRVGLATNATDLLDADLKLLGLTDEVDAVVNSSRLGVHKPAKEYFPQACLAVGAPPARVLLVDDDDRSVRGARAAGLSAYRWNGPDDLRYLRAALAL